MEEAMGHLQAQKVHPTRATKKTFKASDQQEHTPAGTRRHPQAHAGTRTQHTEPDTLPAGTQEGQGPGGVLRAAPASPLCDLHNPPLGSPKTGHPKSLLPHLVGLWA